MNGSLLEIFVHLLFAHLLIHIFVVRAFSTLAFILLLNLHALIHIYIYTPLNRIYILKTFAPLTPGRAASINTD